MISRRSSATGGAMLDVVLLRCVVKEAYAMTLRELLSQGVGVLGRISIVRIIEGKKSMYMVVIFMVLMGESKMRSWIGRSRIFTAVYVDKEKI